MNTGDTKKNCWASAVKLLATAGRPKQPKIRVHPHLSASKCNAFTLVEVLVAAAILVLGIYGMIRIFPGGFSAVESGQQRTIAAQLADAELARWKLNPESIPDDVIATDYQGKVIPATVKNNLDTVRSLLVYGELAAFLPGSTSYKIIPLVPAQLPVLDQLGRSLVYNPNELTPSQFDAALTPGKVTVHPNWQPNSMYLPRTVIGERVDIRRLGLAPPGVPFYLLSHAPLDVLRYEGANQTVPIYVDIYDARPWEYMPSVTDPGALGARQFTVLSNQIHFGPAPGTAETRAFKVDYTDPTVFQRVLGLTVTVEAGSTLGAPTLPAGIDPRSVEVRERLQPVTDRELLQVYGPTARRNIYYVDPETAISGRVEFPSVLQVDPKPTDITIIKIDYRVFDWQILVFDIEVPISGEVRLPVGELKGPGFTNPPRQNRPQEVARAIKRAYDWNGNETTYALNDPKGYAYVVAVDRQSGDILTDHEGTYWPPNPYERRKRFLVNYRDGILTFNFDPRDRRIYGWPNNIDTPDRSGRTYRIFCRAQGDWAVQLMIAARRYARAQVGTDFISRPGNPSVGGSGETALLTYGWNPSNPTQILFPLSEAGQVAAVDYYNRSGSYIQGEVHLIGKPDITNLGEWVCPLAEPLAQPPNDWGPIAVRGIGVQARTAWVTQGRQATLQDLVSAVADKRRGRSSLNESWHQIIVPSYITRAPI